MTTDLLLSVSDLFLTMGLPSIDESLDKLLVAMESFPKSAILGDTVGYARVLGLLLALCVGSYECWMMMLGRRASGEHHQGNGQGKEQTGCRDGIEGCPEASRVSETTP